MNPKHRIILSAAFFASTLSPYGFAQGGSVGQPLAKEAVLCALTSKVDSKKSKVGDAVTAKTLNPLQLTDGTTLPSGTKLVGKLTQVQPKSNGAATVAIVFTEVDKKGGAPMPVHGLIAAVAPMPDLASGGAAANDLPVRGTAAQNAAQTGMAVGGASGAESIPVGSTIKGVTLDSAPAADGSSVLKSDEKDVKLESGTRLEIGLSAAQ
jgi:hypothetical protein